VTKPQTVPARRRGIDCGVCGQYGLGVREVKAHYRDGERERTVILAALTCCYCKSTIRVPYLG
jgi:hypothetical protein